jgi:hypothetical protein
MMTRRTKCRCNDFVILLGTVMEKRTRCFSFIVLIFSFLGEYGQLKGNVTIISLVHATGKE